MDMKNKMEQRISVIENSKSDKDILTPLLDPIKTRLTELDSKVDTFGSTVNSMNSRTAPINCTSDGICSIKAILKPNILQFDNGVQLSTENSNTLKISNPQVSNGTNLYMYTGNGTSLLGTVKNGSNKVNWLGYY
jgi:tetrahydromethanopterin S-methyltransferase subunit B